MVTARSGRLSSISGPSPTVRPAGRLVTRQGRSDSGGVALARLDALDGGPAALVWTLVFVEPPGVMMLPAHDPTAAASATASVR